jgi:hyperosmotically inducible protein
MIRHLSIVFLSLMLLQTTGSAHGPRRPVTDDTITDTVRLRLAGDPVVKGGAITVNVREGVVTLSGSVDTPKQQAKAERVTRSVKGVKAVVNNLQLRVR